MKNKIKKIWHKVVYITKKIFGLKDVYIEIRPYAKIKRYY